MAESLGLLDLLAPEQDAGGPDEPRTENPA